MAGENLIDKLSRKQAEDLLDKATKDIKVTVNVHENYELLEKASDEIKNTILNCKNPEIQLQKMSTNVVCLLPDFLKEPKDIKHKENKKEIDLYIESFENICVQINDYITNVHKSLNNIKNPYIDLDNEMTKILTTFTDTTKNLCGPILYKSEGLDRINTNNLSEEYKPVFENERNQIIADINNFLEEAKNLNYHYLEIFKPIINEIRDICKSMEIIPNPINCLKEEMERSKSILENIFDRISEDNNNIHKELQTLKEIFHLSKREKKKIVEKMQKEIDSLDHRYKNKRGEVDPLKQEIGKIIRSLTSKSEIIKNKIEDIWEKSKKNEIRKDDKEKKLELKLELPSIKLKQISVNDLMKKTNKFYVEIPKEVKNISEDVKIHKIEDKLLNQTSLDLLYLMDITGSMESYVDNTKRELINMMNKIIETFNGIDINLGFIGYKDLEEHSRDDYIHEEFTNNYKKIQNKIANAQIGGGGDTAEDIAWAFEKALNKNWESNAKFAILTTDAPCHGLKYHGHEEYDDYPEGIPGRKDIEESLKELCDKNICLFCIKITDKTDMMFDIFKDIYEKNNKKDYFFMSEIYNAENLHKIILAKCKEVYKMQRFVNN